MAAYTTIDDPEAYFQTVLYTGDGSTQSLTLPGDTDLQPDLVWFKNRTNTEGGTLFDAVRGVHKRLASYSANAEDTNTDSLTAFNSDGFSVGSQAQNNENTESIVAWCWKAGAGSGSSNTDGSINTTSTSVSTTAGFSISTYTGTGSEATVGHGLGVKPAMIIIKRRDASATWHVYHNVLGADFVAAELDTTVAQKCNANFMNDTEPTTAVFTVNVYDEVNASSGTFVAYSFAEKQGFSAMGGYTGNGSANGPFIFCGFRPALIFVKRTDTTSNWRMWDSKREGYNGDNAFVYPNTTAAEESDGTVIDLLSNGFKFKNASGDNNGSGGTYIYACFAEAPFVNSNGVPCNAR